MCARLGYTQFIANTLPTKNDSCCPKRKDSAMPTNLEFRGRWPNIYGNLILISFLTTITAGIYVPWGYARWQRLITESTYFEDKPLEFDGSGAEVFVQFVIIGFFTLITLGLYIILGFSSTRMLRWQYDHTLLPNGQRMDYHGKAVDIFWEWLLLVLFTPLTLGLYYYWGRNRLRRLVLTNVSLDDQQIQVEGSAGEYVVAVLSNWIMTVIAVAAYAALGFLLWDRLVASIPWAGLLELLQSGSLAAWTDLLLTVFALGIYALLGLALLGLATVRFRAWEADRTLAPMPVRSQTPVSVIPTPASAIARPPPPDPDMTESVPALHPAHAPGDSTIRPADSGYDFDPQPPPQPSRPSPRDEDEYYSFADYSTLAGQEPVSYSGDERSDWSSEQWARPQTATQTDGEEESESRQVQRTDDEESSAVS